MDGTEAYRRQQAGMMYREPRVGSPEYRKWCEEFCAARSREIVRINEAVARELARTKPQTQENTHGGRISDSG